MEANAKKFFSSVAISGLEAVTAKRRYLTKCEPKVMEIDDEEKIVKTACRACIANCGVLAHVKNGRVIKLEGNPVDPMSQGRMCAKGLAGIQALYHPNRNKYPLLRVGERGSRKGTYAVKSFLYTIGNGWYPGDFICDLFKEK